MNKILVIQLKQIGDVLLSTPICNTLKKNYPDAQVDYVIYDYAYGVVKNNPNINNVIQITEKERNSKINFFKFLLKLGKYDVCINVQGKIEGALITLFSRAKTRISWDKKGWNLVHNNYVNTDSKMVVTGSGDTIDGRLALLSDFKNLNYDRNIKIWIEDEEKKNAVNKLIKSGINIDRPIVSFALTSRREFRIWPKERFAKLIDFLYEKYKIQAVLFYAPNDKKYNSEEEYCNSVKALVKNKNSVFTNIKTSSIREVASIISVLDMHIGNDNGPRHLAQAVDTPSFAIFVANSRKGFAPHSDFRHRAIDIQDFLNLNDNEYEKYLKEDGEKVTDISYDFVEYCVERMIKELELFDEKRKI
jgi:heptosyltransferase-2